MQDYKDIVVIAWNGVDAPLKYIKQDAEPQFRLFLFNYSGNVATAGSAEKIISIKTVGWRKAIEAW